MVKKKKISRGVAKTKKGGAASGFVDLALIAGAVGVVGEEGVADIILDKFDGSGGSTKKPPRHYIRRFA